MEKAATLVCLFALSLGGFASARGEPDGGSDSSRPAKVAVAYSAKDLRRALGEAGTLVADAQAVGGEAAECLKDFRFENYALAALRPGWCRMTLRAKTPAAPQGTQALEFRFWNPGGEGSFRYVTAFAPQEFQAGQYVTFSRVFHAGPMHEQYGMLLMGGWKGLRIDGLKIENIDMAIRLERVWPNKLLYGTREQGLVSVFLQNATAEAVPARLVVQIESGLDQIETIFDRELSIPAAEKPGQPFELKVPMTPPGEYGHTVLATLYRGPEVLGTAREYFFVSDRPVRIGQYGGTGVGTQYTTEDVQPFVDRMRRHYFPMFEIFFWAPDDATMLVPPPGRNRWWSGQTLARITAEGMKQRVRAGHEHGMKVLSYTDLRLDYGFQIAEFFRKNPELCHWDVNNFLLAYGVRSLQEQAKMDDSKKLEAAGIWGLMTGNPTMIDYHARELVASARRFGFDGFRYDDPPDYDFPAVDMLGRQMPSPGWNNRVILGQIRGALEKHDPGMIYGHNLYWARDQKEGPPAPLDTMPYAGDYYTELVGNGGLHLEEYWTNTVARDKALWSQVAEYVFLGGMNAYRWGGAEYNILDFAQARPTDARHLAAVNLAGMSHLSYDVTDDLIGYMRLACRYCDLLYGDGLVPLPEAQKTLAVDAGGRDVRWKRYARYRQPVPGRRIYLAHLINPPRNERLSEGDPNPPEPIANLALTWTLPNGWKAGKAYHLAGEGGTAVDTMCGWEGPRALTTAVVGQDVVRQQLPVRQQAQRVVVTLPRLAIWSIVALDCTGPKDDRPPKVLVDLPPVPPRPATSVPEPAKGDYSPSRMNAPLVYGYERFPKAMDLKSNKTVELAVVDDPAASRKKAVALKIPVQLETYSSGEQIRGGTYRFSVRLRSMVQPPEDASVEFAAWPPLNHPGTSRLTHKFELADLTPAKAWQVLSFESEFGYGWENFGVWLRGGFDGLLLDWIKIEEVRLWPESKQIENRKGTAWPKDLRQVRHNGIKVWYGEGLFYERYRLLEAMQAISGLAVTEAPHYVWRELRGFESGAWKTPQELATYNLVVLANVDLKTLTLEQRDWLRGYVLGGGRLLMLGGPYGFGRGYWHESDLLESLLPAKMHAFDLRPDGAEQPLAIVPAGSFAGGLKWYQRPTALWLHHVEPKEGARY